MANVFDQFDDNNDPFAQFDEDEEAVVEEKQEVKAPPKKEERKPLSVLVSPEEAETLSGIADLGATAVTGAVAAPVSGVVGLIGGASALGGGRNAVADRAAAWQKATEQFLTKDELYTKKGQEFAQRIAEFMATPFKNPFRNFKPFGVDTGNSELPEELTLSEVGDSLDDQFYSATGGQPELAAITKALVLGAPDIVSGRGGSVVRSAKSVGKGIGLSGKAKNLADEVATEAERLGYKLTHDDIKQSIVDVADMLAPEREVAANTGKLVRSTQAAQLRSRRAVDRAFAKARNARAFAETAPLVQLGADLERQLVTDGFDTTAPTLRKRLSQLQTIDKSIPGVQGTLPQKGPSYVKTSLRALDTLDRQIGLDLKGVKKGAFNAEQSALLRVRSAVRNHIDQEFNKAAITGDPAAQQLWKEARTTAERHAARFKSEKLIRDIVSKGGDPELLYRWIIGASAMGAKKQSAQTIRKLKEILGPDHPSLVALRQTALRDTFRPLFGDEPNFPALIKNIDRLVNDNPALVQELAIPRYELIAMKRMAHAAKQIKNKKEVFDGPYFTKLLASTVWGHDIARKGRKVEFVKKALNRMFRIGYLTRQDIIKHLLDAPTNQPLVKDGGALWKNIMARGAIADATSETEEEE